MKKILIVTGILVIIAVSAFLFYREGTLPVNKSDTSSKVFVVQKGEALDSIINKLLQEKLIRNRIVMRIIIQQKGIAKKIQAGDFRLSPSMDAYKIADELTHGTLDTWVTIPEGLRKEEIAEILSKDLGISEVEFNQIAKEGYLYPDTYLIPKNPSAQMVAEMLENTYNMKVTDAMRNTMEKKGMSEHDVLTLASILEREAFGDNDRQEIANILYRRLQEEIPLQVDATVQYVLGYQTQEKRWWKRELSFDDLKIDSAYNTYKVTGLPPAPISNPGIKSIEAVINADADTPYLFYLHDSSGITHYAKDSDGHQKNIEKYLN